MHNVSTVTEIVQDFFDQGSTSYSHRGGLYAIPNPTDFEPHDANYVQICI